MNRRIFLGTALGGFTSTVVAGHSAIDVAPRPHPVEPVPTRLEPAETLFLTWQRDPTTTMTVQWIGHTVGVPNFVRFVTRVGSGWKEVRTTTRPFPKTGLMVHRAELTGLTPGTEYLLQVGKTSLVQRFRTMPAKASDTFTFVSGGDCGVNSHVVANNILAAKQEPSFALIGGDLGYDNGISAKTAIAFIQNYAKHMIDPKGRLIPLVASLGNHEVRGGYRGDRSDATFFFPLFDGLYRDTSYNTLDFGDYLSLVLLDTGHVSPIAGEQTDWLQGVLKERQERPHLFAVNHVPAYPSYRNPGPPAGSSVLGLFGLKDAAAGTGEGNRKHWCPLFERLRRRRGSRTPRPHLQAHSSAQGWAQGPVRRPLPRRRFVGKAAHAEHAREEAISGEGGEGLPHAAFTSSKASSAITSPSKKVARSQTCSAPRGSVPRGGGEYRASHRSPPIV